MKPITAWAIKDPDPEYGLSIDSVSDSGKKAKFKFMMRHPEYATWHPWHSRGYRAVRVRITVGQFTFHRDYAAD